VSGRQPPYYDIDQDPDDFLDLVITPTISSNCMQPTARVGMKIA
jgi:hypothetical protein